MMQKNLIGDKTTFAIEFTFFDASHETEIALYVGGINVLAFERNGEVFTTRWNIDELVTWLRKFIDEMTEDPYPVECVGVFAAQKDDAARDYDSDDDELFEKYYQQIFDWNLHHRWHSASSGAILADIFFQLVGNNVEISWDNRAIDDDVIFKSISGGAKIPMEVFLSVMATFLTEYALHWFN